MITRYGYFRVKISGNVVKGLQQGRWVYIDGNYEATAFDWLGGQP